ncbi:MAG: DUF1622 domain-containing protein [Planctomycetes bacterium]|nr:DUF1622 domain-containing protein [Planctomycetota bacterium]
MSEFAKPIAEWCATVIELVGIGIISVFALYALASAVTLGFARTGRDEGALHTARQRLGHGILLGLEFLVAADIIQTVAVELTFTSVGVLAIIVVIRTFLSFTLHVELTGRWPWQKSPGEPNGAPP